MSKKVGSDSGGTSAPAGSVLERMTQAVKNAHSAIQLLKNENEQLKEENEELKKKINSLEKQLKESAKRSDELTKSGEDKGSTKTRNKALSQPKILQNESNQRSQTSASWSDQSLLSKKDSLTPLLQKDETNPSEKPLSLIKACDERTQVVTSSETTSSDDRAIEIIPSKSFTNLQSSSKQISPPLIADKAPTSNPSKSVPAIDSAPQVISDLDAVFAAAAPKTAVPASAMESLFKYLSSPAPTLVTSTAITPVRNQKQNLEKGWDKIQSFEQYLINSKKNTKNVQKTEKSELYYYFNLMNDQNYYSVAKNIMKSFHPNIIIKWMKVKLFEDVDNSYPSPLLPFESHDSSKFSSTNQFWKIEDIASSSKDSPFFNWIDEKVHLSQYIRLILAFSFYRNKGGYSYCRDILDKLKDLIIAEVRNRNNEKSWDDIFHHAQENRRHWKAVLCSYANELRHLAKLVPVQKQNIKIPEPFEGTDDKMDVVEENPDEQQKRKELLEKLFDFGSDDDSEDGKSTSEDDKSEDGSSESSSNENLETKELFGKNKAEREKIKDGEGDEENDDLESSFHRFNQSSSEIPSPSFQNTEIEENDDLIDHLDVEGEENTSGNGLSDPISSPDIEDWIDVMSPSILLRVDLKDYCLCLIFIRSCLLLGEETFALDFLDEVIHLIYKSHQVGISSCLLYKLVLPLSANLERRNTNSWSKNFLEIEFLLRVKKLRISCEKIREDLIEDEKKEDTSLSSPNSTLRRTRKFLLNRLEWLIQHYRNAYSLLISQFPQSLMLVSNSHTIIKFLRENENEDATSLQQSLIEILSAPISPVFPNDHLSNLIGHGYLSYFAFINNDLIPHIISSQNPIIDSGYDSTLKIFGFETFLPIIQELFAGYCSINEYYQNTFHCSSPNSSTSARPAAIATFHEVLQRPLSTISRDDTVNESFLLIIKAWSKVARLHSSSIPPSFNEMTIQYWKLQSLFGHGSRLYDSANLIAYEKHWRSAEIKSISKNKKFLYHSLIQLKSHYLTPLLFYYHPDNNNSFNNKSNIGWKIGNIGEGITLTSLWVSKKATMIKQINEINQKMLLGLPHWGKNGLAGGKVKIYDDSTYDFMQSSSLTGKELAEIGEMLDFIFHQILPKCEESLSPLSSSPQLKKADGKVVLKHLLSHAIKLQQIVIISCFERFLQAVIPCLTSLLFSVKAEMVQKEENKANFTFVKDQYEVMSALEIIRILLMIPKPFGIHDNLEIYSECQQLLSLFRSNLSANPKSSEDSIFLEGISELQRKLMIFSSQELPLVVINLPRRNDRWLKFRMKLDTFHASNVIRFPAIDGFHVQKAADPRVISRIQQFYQKTEVEDDRTDELEDDMSDILRAIQSRAQTEQQVDVADVWDCFLYHQMNCTDAVLKQHNHTHRHQNPAKYELNITRSEKAVIQSHLDVWRWLISSTNQFSKISSSSPLSVLSYEERVLRSCSFFPFYTQTLSDPAQNLAHLFTLKEKGTVWRSEYYVVMTDEAHVNTKHFTYAIPPSVSLTAYIQFLVESLPADVDFLCLGGEYPPLPPATKNTSSDAYRFQEQPEKKLFYKINYINKIYAYVIHRRMISKLLDEREGLLPFNQPFEAFLSTFFYQEEFKAYSLRDPLFVLASSESEKELTDDSNVMHSYVPLSLAEGTHHMSGKKRQFSFSGKQQERKKQQQEQKKVKFAT